MLVFSLCFSTCLIKQKNWSGDRPKNGGQKKDAKKFRESVIKNISLVGHSLLMSTKGNHQSSIASF